MCNSDNSCSAFLTRNLCQLLERISLNKNRERVLASKEWNYTVTAAAVSCTSRNPSIIIITEVSFSFKDKSFTTLKSCKFGGNYYAHQVCDERKVCTIISVLEMGHLKVQWRL